MKLILFVLFSTIFPDATKGKPRIILPQAGVCVGKYIEIKCEWKGDHPNVTISLSCSPGEKYGNNSVSIKKFVTRNSDICTCYGSHLGENGQTKETLNIHYPPEKVTITQTSYLEGQKTSLICNASGGNPAVYNYTWSPGNHPHEKIIEINLTKADNEKEYTCKVYHECSGDNPVSSTRNLKVEYYPIIKMNERMTVIENKRNKISCRVEGNPTPKIKWKIGHKTINMTVLQVSFTRHNASVIQCIATAKSYKHGILKNSKNSTVLVTYPPDVANLQHNVTKLQQKAQITCKAHAYPNNIHYKMVQKWGGTIKREFERKQMNFESFSYKDLGRWTCQAGNGVPDENYYTGKSVEIKVDVAAHFKGVKTEAATIGSTKSLKTCFYCNPRATEVRWYKGHEEMPSHRVTSIPAEDGQFPFNGNCSILEVDIKEKILQFYYLHVINPVGQRTFELSLDSRIPHHTTTTRTIVKKATYLACIIVGFITICTTIGIYSVRRRRCTKKTQRNNPPVDGVMNPEGNGETPDQIYDCIIHDVQMRSLGHEYESIDDDFLESSGHKHPSRVAVRQNSDTELEDEGQPQYIRMDGLSKLRPMKTRRPSENQASL